MRGSQSGEISCCVKRPWSWSAENGQKYSKWHHGWKQMFKQPCRHKNPKPVTPAYTLLDTVYVTGASFHLCPLSLHPLSCGSWALDRTLLAAGTGSVDWNVRLLKSAWHHLLPVPPLQKYLKREHVKAEVSGCHEQQHISSSRWRFQKWYSSYFSTLSLFIKSGTLHIHQH